MGLFGFGKDRDKEKANDEHEATRRRMESVVARKRRAAEAAAPARVASPGAATRKASATAARPASAADGREYTVRSGDSLSKIAQSQLGDAGKWRQIYDANRAVIGADPDLIKPGQHLRIPTAAGSAPTRTA